MSDTSVSVPVGSYLTFLPNPVPTVEYMYGCAATAMGMLLAYYDKYGYKGYDVSDLFVGEVELNARGLDGDKMNMNAFDTVIGSGIASERHVKDFWHTDPDEEFLKTYKNSSLIFNTANWDCLADYIGTNQYWRGNVEDTSSIIFMGSLREAINSKEIISISSPNRNIELAIQYADVTYGVSMYVNAMGGYKLDQDASGTFVINEDSDYYGRFTFSVYMKLIDSGCPVMINIDDHAMLGYGYNAQDQTVIFDDTYSNNRSMRWGGSYFYSGKLRQMFAITVIAFDTSNLKAFGADPDPVDPGTLLPPSFATGKFGSDDTVTVLRFKYSNGVLQNITQNGSVTNVEKVDIKRWTIGPAGDYDKDGKTEILLVSNITGKVYVQDNCSETLILGQGMELGTLMDGFSIAGSGDFSGSGFDGVLLFAPKQVSDVSVTVGLACWERNIVGETTSGWLGAMVSTYNGSTLLIPTDMTDEAEINSKYYSFEFCGIGDFNGDGRDDVMIRNNMPTAVDGKTISGAGDVFVFLSGDNRSGYQEIDAVYAGRISGDWELAACGDFNGNGVTDILLRNAATGEAACWLMADGRLEDVVGVGGKLLNAHNIVSIGDLNSDGIDDLILADSSDKLFGLYMENGVGKELFQIA